VQFLSELFLRNLLRELNETLWEASLPTGDVHIISRLWSDDFFTELWPFKIFHCTYSAILVRAISRQLMTGIQWNFMGSFTTNRRCAYYQPVLVRWLFTELWPFEIFHCTYSAILVRAFSQQLIMGIQWNFMGSFTTNRRYAYYQPVMVGWFFTELRPFEIFHCTYSAILVRAISQQLITGIQLNFMGSFTSDRRCAYYQPVMVRWFFTELWPFEIFYKLYI